MNPPDTGCGPQPLIQASSVPKIQPDGLPRPRWTISTNSKPRASTSCGKAFARLKKLALLWSLGKDSNVMIWLARKAFFGRVPFPAMHVDTGKKFPEMYAFRDRYAKEWDLDLNVEHCPPIDAVDPTLPPAARSAARKTEGLKLALAKHGFDGLIAGIRRDEEATRAKERVFSPRGARGRLGRARSAAGILGPVQRLAAARRASAHPSDPALDRGRHLGLHAARKHPDHPALSRARTASATARSAIRTSPIPVASTASNIDEILDRTRRHQDAGARRPRDGS